jgi:Protein of unknown function (DUF3048) N-terminal domain/Protein of unknown function (DUF3048) C-terminal domain
VALTQRGKVVIGVVATAVVGVLAVLAFTGNAPGPLKDIVEVVAGGPDPCPLTGKVRGDEGPPERPVLAVKVENTRDAYPLAGLERADVIYEEPVEGGITRFAALFQCRDSGRVGPVRSARTTDPKILLQLSDQPILAFSGAHPKVTAALEEADLLQLTETSGNVAYERDDARSAPHNLFVATRPLFRLATAAGVDVAAPRAVFRFDEDVPTPSKRRSSATVAFSSSNVVEWAWDGDRWVRQLDGAPMLTEGGAEIAVDNVVIQEVVVTESDILDVAGFPSPEVELLGEGRAWVLRDGRLVIGRWRRDSLGDVTVFETRAGEEITLAPGTTFVELMPKDGDGATFGR